MRNTILIAMMLFAGHAFAQTMDVKDIKADGDDETTTTIEIKKSKPAKEEVNKAGAQWEVHDGEADVEGAPAPTAKEARSTWKAACDEWKKEIRADNKDNKILAVNCGTATCGGDAGAKTCSSHATYKVKTRVD